MSDSDQKKPGVPAWQLKATEKPAPAADVEPEPPQEPTRETVIEQAKKFLEEDEVRDASRDKKIAFLESKGLQSHEIEELLGVTRTPDATTPSLPSEPAQKPVIPKEAPPQSPSQPAPQHNRDIPPIITYPEFLTTSPSPPPLITKQRLLTTLYLFSGLSALLYGTNNYLVQPMISSLTTSRLDLSSTALTNLQKLITKLEDTVSEIPTATSKQRAYGDEEDSDEDPSELFHRDIGVQTESLHSSTSSLPASPEPSHLTMQTQQLQLMTSGFKYILEESKGEAQDNAELSSTIGILKEYLESLAYVTPTYSYGAGGYGAVTSGDKDDEIGRVKAQIRSVKGVLLSARSFPGGASRGIRNI